MTGTLAARESLAQTLRHAEYATTATRTDVRYDEGAPPASVDPPAEDDLTRPIRSKRRSRPAMSVPETIPRPMVDGLEGAAAELLTFAAEHQRRSRDTLVHLVQCARRHGMTNARIGALIGVTEGGVRQMLRRAGDG